MAMTATKEDRLRDLIEDLKAASATRDKIISRIRKAASKMNPVTPNDVDEFIRRNEHLLPP